VLTAERLRELLTYEPDTGVFRWRVPAGRWLSIPAGSLVGFSHKGYWRICIEGRFYKASRLAWLYMTGEWPVHQIDHRNRVKSDDRWENLRDVTCQINNLNKGKSKNNTSGQTGVWWSKSRQKWHVVYRHKHIGYFSSKEEAVQARLKAEAGGPR